MSQVQPPLEFIPPALNSVVLRGCQWILPFWLRSRTNISDIQADNVELLADLYHEFQSGKIRFLMAFRHPSGDDPFSLMHLLWNLVPRVAKQKQIPLNYPVHAHFIYDRGIPLWAGSIVEWLYPRLGGTPILRGKVDRLGLRWARELFANGNLPMMAAPEGATNGHNEVVSPLEPGICQLGFWCVEDILKAGRSEQVLIVPVGIKYQYIHDPWDALDKLLSQLEIDSGLPVEDVNLSEETPKSHHHLRYRRLFRLSAHLLTRVEEFYTRFYHQSLPIASTSNRFALPTTNEELVTRLRSLLDVALKVAEQAFNLQPKGSLIDRCRRLEQAGWDWIFREDIKNIDALPPLERGLADRIAEEASLRMWHMRLVESFVAVTGRYVIEKQTPERFAETTLLIWDTMTKIKGGNAFKRPKLGKQRVCLSVGEPISISQRWDAYKSNRRQAVAELTKDLQTALEKMI
ncbi:MAG TPA: glycerol acyltransferase [Cyanobacteria bacterium UBA11369]|nr:glycerol acyltransferase [Cyanobacteria bacterium UBA11371]HBE33211.1 glycerol acyltransferase [Cyanobacteria bacterium UBA11368]HBE53056.1 glycerol acyltransferase [Cyanobacteria bacterium UBA11369]